jgi:hypothetical protein
MQIKNRINLMVTGTFLSLILFFAGCSTKLDKLERVQAQRLKILSPDLNKSVVSELGDTLVDQGYSSTRTAINVLQDSNADYVAWNIFLGKGLYAGMLKDKKYIYYFPVDAEVRLSSWSVSDGFADGHEVGIAVPADTSEVYLLPWVNLTGSPEIAKFREGSPQYELTGATETQTASFRQQIIYNGRVGNNLKFIYREFSNNQARAPFTQEVQYDLTESSTIGFKGVRIEVIEASNTQLEYKVLSHFNR